MTKEQIQFVERYLFYLNALGLVEPKRSAATGAST